jgi:enoyl-CoA hydratase/carnithine racemase
MSDAPIKTRIDQRVGHILLDRPKALNALDLPMIRQITAALQEFAGDPAIHTVVVQGEGRAFCAGGDIRAIRDAAVAGDTATIHTFFAEEYALNRLIAEYSTPYVALIDGICMGGGIGISVHGRIRVATEAALFAMPETGIGLFPDVGASFLLPRLPGALGMFLGLTGTRLAGADAVHAGLATHFVSRNRLHDLSQALARDGVAAIASFAEPLPPFTLAPHRHVIDRCFSATSVEEIFARLREHAHAGDAFAGASLAQLQAASPSALHWSFDIIRAGAGRTLPDCLAAELRLTAIATAHPDFAEGVRAMVVEKDRKPHWAPQNLTPMTRISG